MDLGREEKVGAEHRVQLCLKRLGAQVKRLLKCSSTERPNGKSGDRAARCVEAPARPVTVSHRPCAAENAAAARPRLERAASHLPKVSKGAWLRHGKPKALKPLFRAEVTKAKDYRLLLEWDRYRLSNRAGCVPRCSCLGAARQPKAL